LGSTEKKFSPKGKNNKKITWGERTAKKRKKGLGGVEDKKKDDAQKKDGTTVGL